MSSSDLSREFNRSSSISSKFTIKSPPSNHALSRRYSDCNIVFLEDQDKINPD